MKIVNKTNIILITLATILIYLTIPTSCLGIADIDVLPEDVLGYIAKIAVAQDPTSRSSIERASKRFLSAMQLPTLEIYSHLKITNKSICEQTPDGKYNLSHEKITCLRNYITNYGSLIKFVDIECHFMDDETLTYIFSKLRYLKSLKLFECHRLKQLNLDNITQLEELILHDTNITDEQLTQICNNNPNIKRLDLEDCKELEQFNLGKLTHIEILSVVGTRITDRQLIVICTNNPNIKKIGMSRCDKLWQSNLRNATQP